MGCGGCSARNQNQKIQKKTVQKEKEQQEKSVVKKEPKKEGTFIPPDLKLNSSTRAFNLIQKRAKKKKKKKEKQI